MRFVSDAYDALQNCKNKDEVEALAKHVLVNGNARLGCENDKLWGEMMLPLYTEVLYYGYSNGFTFNQVNNDLSNMLSKALSMRPLKNIYSQETIDSISILLRNNSQS